MRIFSHYWLLSLLFLGLVLATASVWVLGIWYSVKHSPRADMFYCPRHGLMLSDATIKFMDSVEIVDVEGPNGEPLKSHISHGERYCPMCFHEKLGGSLPR